jgi:rRNA-processing protein EBP2
MGKAKAKGSKKKSPAAKAKPQPRISMKDLEEVSDDEGGELPPEEEWDEQTRALKQAIMSGDYDHLLDKEVRDDEEEESSIEEVEVDANGKGNDDDDDDESVSEEEETAKQVRPGMKKLSAERELGEGSEDEDEEEDAAQNEEEEEEDDDSENDEDKEEQIEKKDPQLNSKALHVVTQDLIAVKKGWAWAESFAVVPETPLPFGEGSEFVNVHDDLKREVAFYDMALEAVQEARNKCNEASIPFSRPDDFLAEMVKTDGTYYITLLSILLSKECSRL